MLILNIAVERLEGWLGWVAHKYCREFSAVCVYAPKSSSKVPA